MPCAPRVHGGAGAAPLAAGAASRESAPAAAEASRSKPLSGTARPRLSPPARLWSSPPQRPANLREVCALFELRVRLQELPLAGCTLVRVRLPAGSTAGAPYSLFSTPSARGGRSSRCPQTAGASRRRSPTSQRQTRPPARVRLKRACERRVVTAGRMQLPLNPPTIKHTKLRARDIKIRGATNTRKLAAHSSR